MQLQPFLNYELIKTQIKNETLVIYKQETPFEKFRHLTLLLSYDLTVECCSLISFF